MCVYAVPCANSTQEQDENKTNWIWLSWECVTLVGEEAGEQVSKSVLRFERTLCNIYVMCL